VYTGSIPVLASINLQSIGFTLKNRALSKNALSGPHNKLGPDEDMLYLKQPRGHGTGWTFKMETPQNLVGQLNPMTGREFGKTIHMGLKTRDVREARKKRDVILGDIRKLEFSLTAAADFSVEDALEMRQEIENAHKKDPTGFAGDNFEFAVTDMLEKAERSGQPRDKLQQFARISFGKGYPISVAFDQYVTERQPGNAFNFKPLSQATVKELTTALKHLQEFMEKRASSACMEDVTPNLAYRFRFEYLPSVISKHSKKGMSPRTADKCITMLRPMWDWAIERRKVEARYTSPWKFPSTVARNKRDSSAQRDYFRPEEITQLFNAAPRGTRNGDTLRLALATGTRINELVLLHVQDIEPDCSGFHIAKSKTASGKRFVPVMNQARELLRDRMGEHGATGRVFPDWPIYEAKGKSDAVSKWFSRFRQQVLGAETNGRLVLHSTRHTWRTIARQARVPEADINDIGGWSGERTSNSTYDHGLLHDQLAQTQLDIWEELRRQRYLDAF